jgi:hypothetical protein
MKLVYIYLAVTLTSCTYNDMRKLFTDHPDAYTKFSGNFNYTKSQLDASAHNRVGMEVKQPIYTTKDKKQMYYVGGNVYHNYDAFKTSYHINGFGHVGIEF